MSTIDIDSSEKKNYTWHVLISKPAMLRKIT
jgi:proteasome lid subunit RPN8/RPN11